MKSLPRVAQAVGPHNRVIFDEQHLGIEESGTIVGMALRFRMTPRAPDRPGLVRRAGCPPANERCIGFG